MRIRFQLFIALLVLLVLSGIAAANPAYISDKKPSTYFPKDFDETKEYPEKVIDLKAKRFSFTPNIVRVDKGDLVTINLVSTDVHHGIYIDGYGIEVDSVPGQTGTLKFYADKSGRFTMRCSITCGDFHPYMVNYLVVEPNSRFGIFALVALAFAIVNIVIVLRKREEEVDTTPIPIPVSAPQTPQQPKKESFVKDGRVKIRLTPTNPQQIAAFKQAPKSTPKQNQSKTNSKKGGNNGTR